MWVIDREKERERIFIKNEVNGLVTRFSQHSNEIQAIISELCFTASGGASGRGDLMARDCQQALSEVSRVLQELNACKQDVDEFEIMEWVDDDDE